MATKLGLTGQNMAQERQKGMYNLKLSILLTTFTTDIDSEC